MIRHIGQLVDIIGPLGWVLLGSAGVLALCYVTLLGCLIGNC